MLTVDDWNKRFHQQAGWTQNLRRYIYDRAGLRNARRVLEVGCGTGVLLEELNRICRANIYGLDIDRERLVYARDQAPHAQLLQGNGLSLPFPSKSFDLVICHYLLLWVSNHKQVVQEMARVTRPGGAVCALAEPDYGGRVDYPDEMIRPGKLQSLALQKQGADIQMGRKLKGLFNKAGIKNIESGVLSAQWFAPPQPAEIDLEWAVLKSDLQGQMPDPELQHMQEIDRQAWSSGERVLYIPTFYAWGRV